MAKVLRIQKEAVSPQQALEQFLLLKRAQGLSERTIEDYRYHVTAFFKYCEGWEDVGDKIKEYMSQEIKPNTYNIRIRYLRAYFDWCVSEGCLCSNPLKGWKLRKGESRIVNIDEEILKKLLDLPDRTTFTGLRDYALILLHLDTGIRPQEALSLTKDDVCLRQGLVNVGSATAKTRVSRTLPILPVTAQAIGKLIAAHNESWKTNLIFCTYEGQAMNRKTWSRRMLDYSRKLGIKIRPYDLRHSFALGYLRGNGDVFSLKSILGHTHLMMTQRYLSLTGEDIKNCHSKSSPLNTLIKAKRVKKLK